MKSAISMIRFILSVSITTLFRLIFSIFATVILISTLIGSIYLSGNSIVSEFFSIKFRMRLKIEDNVLYIPFLRVLSGPISQKNSTNERDARTCQYYF